MEVSQVRSLVFVPLVLNLTVLQTFAYDSDGKDETSLYHLRDDVAVLNVSNIKSTLYGKQNAWILQLYHMWCGHCMNFAPVYVRLAHAVRAWHSVIDVAVINCADESNLPICRRFEATSFPSIKFLRANANERDIGTVFHGKRFVQSLQEAMVDFVSSANASGPSTWPRLEPINSLDMNSLFHEVPTNVSLVAIVVDNSNSYLGKLVILDTLNLTTNMRVFWATKQSSPLIESFGEIPVPFLILARRSGQLDTFTTGSDGTRSGFVQYLSDFASHNGSVKHSSNAANAAATLQPLVLPSIAPPMIENFDVLTEMDRVHLQDLENVLHYVLFQETALHNNISGDKLDALKAFLNVLAKYLPVRDTTIILLNRLVSWVNNQMSSISVDSFQKELHEIQDSLSIDLKLNLWLGCRGSQSRYRGYPCGLWTTFHTLTVSAYVRREEDVGYDPLDVMIAIRKYVINFFGCQECARHFEEMSANIAAEIKNYEDLVLWLWQAHNKVNARLEGDVSEDPMHPKRQFPTPEMCPSCRLEGDSNTQWDLAFVLELLVTHYSGDGIVGLQGDLKKNHGKSEMGAQALMKFDVSMAVREEPSFKKRDVRKGEEVAYSLDGISTSHTSFFRWGFSKSDISICVLLYVSSILLLLLCYFFILTRRRSLFASLRSKKHFYV